MDLLSSRCRAWFLILIMYLPWSVYADGNAVGKPRLDTEEQAFVTLLNDYRAAHGLVALQISAPLVEASRWMSTDMAARNYFSHTDRNGRDPFTRMADLGYAQSSSDGENIAAGNETAQATFIQWQNSPGHNANMLRPEFRALGVARAYDPSSDYGWYWTTDFGARVD